jgi:SpoVK/Ycf46/Vps4 family AAA+-type ATPase
MDKSYLSVAVPDLNQMLKPLALAAAGKTGADIERHIREARQKARREKRPLTYTDIHEALSVGQTAMPPELIWRIAVHEAGHALGLDRFRYRCRSDRDRWEMALAASSKVICEGMSFRQRNGSTR